LETATGTWCFTGLLVKMPRVLAAGFVASGTGTKPKAQEKLHVLVHPWWQQVPALIPWACATMHHTLCALPTGSFALRSCPNFSLGVLAFLDLCLVSFPLHFVFIVLIMNERKVFCSRPAAYIHQGVSDTASQIIAYIKMIHTRGSMRALRSSIHGDIQTGK